MKQIYTLILFISISNCFSQEFKSLTNYEGYVPNYINSELINLPLTDYKGTVVNISSLTLEDFNKISTTVTAIDSKLEIGGFGVTGEKGDYKIIYTFENYIEVYDINGKKCRLGTSIEIIANIQTKKVGLNLSDLFSLAIQAEKNKVSGSLSMTASGFSSKTNYGLFNINSTIDMATVQQIVKNVGIMISKFSDETISLKPVIIGYESKAGSL